MSISLKLGERVHDITIVRRHPRLVLSIDGEHHEIGPIRKGGDGNDTIVVDGRSQTFRQAGGGGRQFYRLAGQTYALSRIDHSGAAALGGASTDTVRAPMPGAVVSVHKRPGESVQRGETLVTIESMKLQTALAAARDGIVAEIRRGEGETFEKDEIIATLEAETGDA